MYVYIWKDTHSIPFYVGFTKNKRRTNPRNSGGRNWLCQQKIEAVGVDRIIIELRPVASAAEGVALECQLIAEYGRIQTRNGPLANLTSGGEGTHTPSLEHREKLRQAMLDPNHPIRSEAARKKAVLRMNAPDVKAKFLGENNAAKRPEVRAKIKAKWEDPEFRAARISERIGVAKNFSDETRLAHAERLKANPAMRGWGERNGLDDEFNTKRIAGIQAAQPKRAEKMRDPVALAQRKERLKATLNSPEYKAKRALWDTPELKQRQSDIRKAYWSAKKSVITLPS
jgi:hypothetical protein